MRGRQHQTSASINLYFPAFACFASDSGSERIESMRSIIFSPYKCALIRSHNLNTILLCRATVIEHDDIWYKNDGALTKVFCEDSEYC
jgi:hypothetical protein